MSEEVNQAAQVEPAGGSKEQITSEAEVVWQSKKDESKEEVKPSQEKVQTQQQIKQQTKQVKQSQKQLQQQKQQEEKKDPPSQTQYRSEQPKQVQQKSIQQPAIQPQSVKQLKEQSSEVNQDIEPVTQQIKRGESDIKKQSIVSPDPLRQSENQGQQQAQKLKQSSKKSEVRPEKNQQAKQERKESTKQEKKELSQREVLQQFFKNYEESQSKQIKLRISILVNKLVESRLYISNATILKYLSNGDSQHSLQLFQNWLKLHQQQQINALIQSFKETNTGKELNNSLKKIQTLLSLTDHRASIFKVQLGVSQPRSKSILKFGIALDAISSSSFSVCIQVRVKRKTQLRQYLENEMKRHYKSQQYHVSKLFQYQFTETQKSLKIDISSPILSQYILKDTLELITKMVQSQQKPILKLQAQIGIKNSLRADQLKLQTKKLVKWIAQGITSSISIHGNSKVVHHFTSSFSQIFPILSVVKSGQIHLKLKSPENVDKLFEKLGISQLSQSTPSLKEFIQILVKQHLDSEILPWISDILKRSIMFSCNVPNERVSLECSVKMSALTMSAAVSTQACKQLGQLFGKASTEQQK